MAHCFDSPLSHFDPTTFLDLVESAILVIDTQLCVVYANGPAEVLLGVGLTTLQGRPVKDLFRDAHFVSSLLQQGLQGEEDEDPKWPPMYLLKEMKRTHLNELVQVTARRLEDDLTGPHLLLQMGRARHTRANVVLATTGQFALPDFSALADSGQPLHGRRNVA